MGYGVQKCQISGINQQIQNKVWSNYPQSLKVDFHIDKLYHSFGDPAYHINDTLYTPNKTRTIRSLD